MSVARVKEYLKNYDLDQEVIELDQSSATVELAAKALGTTTDEIGKTLSFLVDGQPILVVVSGDSRIDNKKFKAQFHTKAKMIPKDQVEELIGHDVGGVCPFGVNEDVKIYLDQSLNTHDYVYPAAGEFNTAIKLTPQKLEEILVNPVWVDVTKKL